MAVKTSCSYWTRLCHYTHKMAVKTSCSYRVKLFHYHPLHTEISSRCRAVFTCSLYVHCCFEKLLLLPTSSFMSRVMFLLCSVYPLHIHVAVFAVAQRLLVHDMPVFYQNCWRNQASFLQGDHLSQKKLEISGNLNSCLGNIRYKMSLVKTVINRVFGSVYSWLLLALCHLFKDFAAD